MLYCAVLLVYLHATCDEASDDAGKGDCECGRGDAEVGEGDCPQNVHCSPHDWLHLNQRGKHAHNGEKSTHKYRKAAGEVKRRLVGKSRRE